MQNAIHARHASHTSRNHLPFRFVSDIGLFIAMLRFPLLYWNVRV
jgi:hypothetical protein